MRSTGNGRIGIKLDPRTKLFLFLLISVFTLGGAGGEAASVLAPVLNAAPFILLLATGQWGHFALYAAVYFIAYIVEVDILPLLSGGWAIACIFYVGAFARFMPSIIMGFFVISSTTVSEFVSGMEKMHIPPTFTIPLSVMFRFFPTVLEEMRAINDAMRMRGIRFGGGDIGRMLEYRLIPMMICSVKIGEELSSASLTRGLGAPVKRTNMCRIGFGFWDYVFFALAAGYLAGLVLLSIGSH